MPLTRRDLLPAVAAAGALLAELALVAPTTGSALLAFGALGLALRRHAPEAAVAMPITAFGLDAATGGVLVAELVTPFLVVALGCFLVGLQVARTPRAVAGTSGAVLSMTVVNQLTPGLEYPPLDDLVWFTMMLGAPATVGHVLRHRADVVAELAVKTGELRLAALEEAAAATAEERARLALGLHDAVAQRVGEMALHAAGAARVADPEPERALAAIARIEAAGRAALCDIRETIGVLRHGDEAVALTPARAPAARLPAAWSPAAAPGTAPGPASRRERLAAHADVLVAVAIFAAIAIDAAVSAQREGGVPANVAGAALVAAPLVLRRRLPLMSAAGTFAAGALVGLVLTPLGLLVTPMVLLLVPPFSVAAHLPRGGAIAGLAVCVAGAAVIEPAPPTVVVGLLAWAAGRLVRDRTLRAGELRAVAEALERSRDATTARARAEERLRVARELHDAVAHSMTVVVLQAGAAQRIWTTDPGAARAAVAALTDVSRETLGQLRATLRGAAAPGEATIEELIERVRPLGVHARVHPPADWQPLPPELDRVVVAVVQEALTNAVRHAAPTLVDIRLERDECGLRVGVRDTGRGVSGREAPAVPGTGTGLRGMRERVIAAGGSLQAGPHGTGFCVEVRLPLAVAVPT